VTLADARHFAIHYSKPEEAIKKALSEAERLEAKYRDRGVTLAYARYFAVHYSKPEEAIKKALSEAENVTPTTS
jgi:hypothetical protein